MPLTSVVQYFNKHLPDFHPQAQLGRDACFECLAGRVSARVAGYRLFPRQAPVLVTGTGEVFGWSGKVLIESDDGRRVSAKSLYVHAWDSEDVIFLDRFLRTLHALHHLSLGEDRVGLLAARPATADTDWALLRALGIQWVTPDASWNTDGDLEPVRGWARQAQAHGISLWLDGVSNPQAIARACSLGADLIEGALWEPVAQAGTAARPSRQSVEAP